jgi:predicted transcriptional regulator
MSALINFRSRSDLRRRILDLADQSPCSQAFLEDVTGAPAADIRRELKALTAAGLLAEKTTYTKGAKA